MIPHSFQEETISTLRLGSLARRIKTNPKINEKYSSRQLTVMVEQLTAKLASVTEELNIERAKSEEIQSIWLSLKKN